MAAFHPGGDEESASWAGTPLKSRPVGFVERWKKLPVGSREMSCSPRAPGY